MPRDRDIREWIVLVATMPEHPKIEGLSDKAFRLLVESWCYCRRARNDGHMKAATWKRRGTPAARRELVDAGLMEDDLTGGVIVHDWDEYQQTLSDITEQSKRNRDAGIRGAHNQWHVKAGKRAPGCEYCHPPLNGHGPPLAVAMANP